MGSVVLLSGGLDSTVLLAHVRNTVGGRILALTVDYGQRHRRELWSAFQVARFYGAEDRVITLPPGLLGGSSLTGGGGPTAGAATVVPGRNLVLISLAVATAAREGCDRVYIAAHAGDAPVYPDCRIGFAESIDEATADAYGVRVLNPFAGLSKREVVAEGRRLAVPLDLTWSCYDPRGFDPSAPASGVPCGSCGACAERAGAMA